MLLYLKIKPNQRFNAVELIDGQWTVRVNSPAIEGQANEGLVEYLSEVLLLPKSKIIIRKGATSRLKCLEIDAPEKDVLTRLDNVKSTRK
jgi:uncharacterized protein (TIGR00251 family)